MASSSSKKSTHGVVPTGQLEQLVELLLRIAQPHVEHLVEPHGDEPRPQLTGHGPGQERLAAPRGSPQQQASPQLGAVGPAQLGVAQRGQERSFQTLLHLDHATHIGQGERAGLTGVVQHVTEEPVPFVLVARCPDRRARSGPDTAVLPARGPGAVGCQWAAGPSGHVGPAAVRGLAGTLRSATLRSATQRSVQASPSRGPAVPEDGSGAGGEPQGPHVIGCGGQDLLGLVQGVTGPTGVEQEPTQVDAERRVGRVRSHRGLEGTDHCGVGGHPVRIVPPGGGPGQFGVLAQPRRSRASFKVVDGRITADASTGSGW